MIAPVVDCELDEPYEVGDVVSLSNMDSPTAWYRIVDAQPVGRVTTFPMWRYTLSTV